MSNTLTRIETLNQPCDFYLNFGTASGTFQTFSKPSVICLLSVKAHWNKVNPSTVLSPSAPRFGGGWGGGGSSVSNIGTNFGTDFHDSKVFAQ